ncbi:MAG: M14 family metallopeptidase [bacterium]
MEYTRTIKRIVGITPALLLAAVLAAASTPPAAAQEKLQTSPGGYHGEMDFPVSWKRYYSYDEWVQIMHDMQEQYSGLADIESIGKSRMGRDQWLLTLTSKETGPAESKTAMWVDGAIHGNEVNGITCSLYAAWYLLTRYDYDPYVHDLLDSFTFYILPGMNVDANDSFVRFPNTPNNPRETYRPEDNDGDGLYDEDQTEDVDGDGELSVMWAEDPDGGYVLSEDGRRFVRMEEKLEGLRRFRRIGSEGYDNDGDGRINEDDIGGPDPNRNFPYGWNLGAGWPYPLSEPETRNVYEFWLDHDNIFASFHYHNTGRLIMFSAPPPAPEGAQTSRRGYRGDPEQIRARLREENRYAQYFDRVVPREYQHDMDVQTEIVTMGARILQNYRPTISGLSGQAQAGSYYMRGHYAYLIELWGRPTFDQDIDGDGRVSDEERMMWHDLELTGEGWITPREFDHPQLGRVWIGGTPKKHTVRTPPARYIESEAFRNAQFVLYVASQFPRVEIDDVEVEPATDDLLWVEVTVANEKTFPTSSDREVVLETAVMDRIAVTSSRGLEVLSVPSGESRIDPYDRAGRATLAGSGPVEFRLQGDDRQVFRYLVRLDGRNGSMEVTVTSKAGGTAKRTIELNRGS